LTENRIAPLANFTVGQRVDFYPYFTPSLPEVPQKTVKWTLAPTFINSFTVWVLDYETSVLPSVQNVLARDETYYDQAWGLTDFTVDAQRLQQEQTFAWWLTGSETAYQTNNVSVAMLLTFSNGQSVSVARKGLIGMHKPTVSWDASAYQAGIVHGRETSFTWEGVFTANSLQVRVGSFTYESDRIELQATSSSLKQGQFALTQLLVRDSILESFTDWRLDNSFPYTDSPDSYHALTANSSGTAYCPFSDGPSCPIGGYMLDHFRQYFMYRPDAAGSIWVTLGIANWEWRGEITYSTNSPEGWEWVSTPYCNHSQSIQPSIEIPQWTKRKLNFGAE
jgi:hypothetical protein